MPSTSWNSVTCHVTSRQIASFSLRFLLLKLGYHTLRRVSSRISRYNLLLSLQTISTYRLVAVNRVSGVTSCYVVCDVMLRSMWRHFMVYMTSRHKISDVTSHQIPCSQPQLEMEGGARLAPGVIAVWCVGEGGRLGAGGVIIPDLLLEGLIVRVMKQRLKLVTMLPAQVWSDSS